MTRYAFTSWVCVSSWQNVIQCKIIVVGTSMEAVLSSLPGVYMSACLSVDRFLSVHYIRDVQDAVMGVC